MLQEIRSKDNAYLKQVRLLQQKKHRQEQGLFLVEGLRLAEEAVASGFAIAYGLVGPRLLELDRGRQLVQALRARNVPLFLVAEERLLAGALATEHPQGIALVLAMPPAGLEALDAAKDWVLVADRISDPGNLGGLFRSAYAAGAQALLATPGCCDCYNPKVLRAAMGAIFRLPFYEATSDEELSTFLHKKGLHIYIAAAEGSMVYTQADLRRPLALVMGAEADGVQPFWRQAADGALRLPMTPGAESLNVGAAAAVLLYEIRRQRT